MGQKENDHRDPKAALSTNGQSRKKQKDGRLSPLGTLISRGGKGVKRGLENAKNTGPCSSIKDKCTLRSRGHKKELEGESAVAVALFGVCKGREIFVKSIL